MADSVESRGPWELKIKHLKGELMEKVGITNLLPIIMFSVEMANVGDKMGRSKGMARYAALTELADEAYALVKVDFKAAKAEFKDLDQGEKGVILDAVKAKFDIVNDELEVAIEEALDVAVYFLDGIPKVTALAKKFKKK